VVEYLCAEAGFAPRVAHELDDFPAAQAFVAAGIAVVPTHGLILATLLSGATARPLVERPAGSRTIEALAPAGARTPAVDDLLDHLADAARGYIETVSWRVDAASSLNALRRWVGTELDGRGYQQGAEHGFSPAQQVPRAGLSETRLGS
jgi:LysR substrate binding domain